MTAQSRFLDDPRRRNLAVLAAIAFIAVALAIVGVLREAGQSAPLESDKPFLPDIASQVRQIAHIRVQSKSGVVDVVFKPEKGWVVTSHYDYPASFEAVRETVVGLAALRTIEKKTARAGWLPYVDLVAPEHGGSGKEITLSDEKGTVIASVIAGKTEDIGDPSGAIGLFVRRPNEAQTWLVRSVIEPKSEPTDWLDKQVMTIDRARIAETDVDPLTGPSYVVRRQKASDNDFALADLPKGRTLSDPGAPDGVAAAVTDFSFDDVRPAKEFDFSFPGHAARVVTRTFDGLIVTVSVAQQGQDYWAAISADGSSPDAQKEARVINAHASGWAYKLPSYKGQQFLTPMENLLKPKAGKVATSPSH